LIQKGAQRLGRKGHSIQIKAPLLHLSKKDIVLLGTRLGVPFDQTWSCYRGQQEPCGTCDSCLLRLKGFEEASQVDPLDYHASSRKR